ncbi:nuclear transport factor 2 family protein [Cnuibacter physcomitrellae]|uniref:nuclear transport factor 2 family protein n=1 Tax=Cnuibacter physcomitrellae TaxID=1619308 RepID=UPI0021761AA4|nr:nuclear transport factor 2 family protein [Cnuibacter physcomitrellae]MCS5498269.1 nuclear transport factor 2 family protein [Cnuibacter physcomitrellae]
MVDRDSLESCMAEYTDALWRQDVERAASYLADDFALVFVHPVEQVVGRSAWLDTVREFQTHDFKVLREVVRVRAGTAIANRLVYMNATTKGVDRTGEFVAADYWALDPRRGWLCWQRLSTPLGAAGAIPD